MRPTCSTWRLSTYCAVVDRRTAARLRHSLTAYDAAYVALAEALGAPLITRDGRMAAAHGHRAKIELIQ